jgi:hypothetical protein
MRDTRFIANHRGGLLTKEHHCLLIRWARTCAKHVLPLAGIPVDERLTTALSIAGKWERGAVSVGDARKTSVAAHAAARAINDPIAKFVARSIGHAVATAHMADHSLRAAWYALKAVKLKGRSVESECAWQNRQLPSEIRERILSNRSRIDHAV